jgi:CRISPR-associated protein Cmr3
MHTILLEPNDVLFFRDGRPMSGSLAGHGAAWPHPAVINGAFHAALHRSGFDKTAHSHRRGARGLYAEDAPRDRKFGSLVTVGPFPVRNRTEWYFPRPHDLTRFGLQPTLRPTRKATDQNSSLPEPLKFAVASETPPDKSDSGPEWISRQAFERYLTGGDMTLAAGESAVMTDFADREHAIGIAIDPETGTTGSGNAKGMIYSSHFLRLREDWQLGVAATAEDKDFRHPVHGSDLVLALLAGGSEKIVVGGQQRVCTASLAAHQPLTLPKGLTRNDPSSVTPAAGSRTGSLKRTVSSMARKSGQARCSCSTDPEG